ncbi:MAG: glycosyltransferase [Patescibacteria group bacterium]
MKQENGFDVSIIIPALNEELTIASSVQKISRYLQSRNMSYEILIVDDGSTDATVARVERLHDAHIRLLRHEKNLGKGAAVKSGMLAARGAARVFIDADLQIHIENLDRFWEPLHKGADVIIASSPDAPSGARFWARGILGFLAKKLIRFVMGWDIPDTQRGLKMFRDVAAVDIFSSIKVCGWGFDIEVLAIAMARKYKIEQIPVSYDRPIVTRVSMWSYLRSLWELVVIRTRLLFGVYKGGGVRSPRFFILFILSSIVFLVILFLKFIFFDGDVIGLFYPNYTSTHHLWNSGILSGFPTPASFQWGLFHPIYRIFSGSYNALIAFFVFLAGYLSYVFARQLFSSRLVSVFAATTFILGQFTMHWLGNIAVVSAIYVLPASLLLVSSMVRGSWGLALFYSALIGLSFLGSHQQFVIMALVVAALYWVWLEYVARKAGKSLGGIIWDGGRGLGALAVAFIIGLPQFIYVAVFTPLSTRIGGLTLAQASVDAATPLDLIKFIFPYFSFRYGVSGEFLPYIGIFGLAFAFIAIVKTYKNESHVRFFTLLSVGAILTSFQFSPIFWVLHKLPVLEYFRGPARWTFALNFSMAILAGYGMKWTAEHWESVRMSIQLYSRRALLGVLGVASVMTLIFAMAGESIIRYVQHQFTEKMYQSTTGLPLEYYHTLIERIVKSSFDNFSLGDASFLIALVSIVAVYVVARYTRGGRTFTVASVTSSCVLLGISGMIGHTFARSDALFSSPPIAGSILSRSDDPMSFRTFSFLYGSAGSQRISATHEGASRDAMMYGIDSLMPNTGLLRGIATIDGYEPMAPRRGQRVLAFVGSEVSQRFASLAHEAVPLPEKLFVFSSRLPLLSMLNVKYLISAYELPPTPGLQLSEEVSSTRFNIPIYLYENKQVMPRIYFARGVTYVSETDEEKNFKTIIESNTNFAHTTFIECADCETMKNQPTPSDTLTIEAYRDGYLRLTTKTARDRWLVFSESNLPGWRITIDGAPAQSYMANYLFHGLPIPAGEHTVLFEYEGVLTWGYVKSLF